MRGVFGETSLKTHYAIPFGVLMKQKSQFQIHACFNPVFSYCKQLVKQPVKQLSKHSSVLGVITEHSSGVPFNLDELARLSKIKAINQYTGQYELCLDYKNDPILVKFLTK